MKQKTRDRLEALFAAFPDRPAALIPSLYLVQEEENHLTEGNLGELAQILDMPKSEVYQTATFYSLFTFRPRGKHVLRVCRNVCCFLRGADGLLAHLEVHLGVKDGETTADGRFTLEAVECLAACDRAPVMMVDDETYGPVTPEEAGRILEEYR